MAEAGWGDKAPAARRGGQSRFPASVVDRDRPGSYLTAQTSLTRWLPTTTNAHHD